MMTPRATYGTTQIFAFSPSATTTFNFQPTLDGTLYNVTVTWNVFGQRYYVNVFSQQGARICTVPMTASPNDWDINIVGGYFTSIMVFRTELQRIEILSDPVPA